MKKKFTFFSIVLLLGMMPFIQAVHGQLAIYTSSLSGPAEAPPNTSPGIGTVTVTINSVANTMRVQCSFSGLTSNTTAAHIHAATAVANTGTASVATQTPSFAGFPIGVSSGVYDATFDMTLASSYRAAYITANGGTPASAFAALNAALEDQKAYFNIHSSAFPGGEIRDFLRRTWYRDFDKDGFGNPAKSVVSATQPNGYVSNNTDCNDGDATRNPNAPELEDGIDNDCDGQVDEGLACLTMWYLDADGDGVGRNSTTRMSCVKPANHVAVGGDCNDQDATINPNATEVADGKDNDCNGQIDDGLPCLTTWYVDRDLDGHGSSSLTKMSCIQPTDYVSNNTDCNDQNASIYTGALELCDGKDNDCDGIVDEGCQVGSLWYLDYDKDGYGNPQRSMVSVTQPDKHVSNNRDCNDGDPTRYPGATELADGIDNDCDGQVDEGLGCRKIWYVDRDKDGYGSPSLSKFTCIQPAGYVLNSDDCNDQRASVYPGAPEICDGFDNDCNGLKDDNCTPLVTENQKPENNARQLVKANATTTEISVYPNPARGEMVVTINGFEAGKKVEMKLVQVDGKAVMAKNLVPSVQNEQVRLDVRGISSGFYLLQVKQGINQQTKKVMIVR